ncbi:MAG TPA: hypothetical protein VND23_06680 [Acidimicrobiales bacterium]|nr:hypothetical protein [Acidimicrobiales bacterium]
MSTRHRSEVPKPAPSERRVEHHRERQATRHALAASDPEDVVDPRARHTLHVEHPGDAIEVRPARQFRHWKARFWKRRSAQRHERNQALAELAAVDAAQLEEPSAAAEKAGDTTSGA